MSTFMSFTIFFLLTLTMFPRSLRSAFYTASRAMSILHLAGFYRMTCKSSVRRLCCLEQAYRIHITRIQETVS